MSDSQSHQVYLRYWSKSISAGLLCTLYSKRSSVLSGMVVCVDSWEVVHSKWDGYLRCTPGGDLFQWGTYILSYLGNFLYHMLKYRMKLEESSSDNRQGSPKEKWHSLTARSATYNSWQYALAEVGSLLLNGLQCIDAHLEALHGYRPRNRYCSWRAPAKHHN